MCDDVESYVAQARTLAPDLAVIALNAREPDAVAALAPWCGSGPVSYTHLDVYKRQHWRSVGGR